MDVSFIVTAYNSHGNIVLRIERNILGYTLDDVKRELGRASKLSGVVCVTLDVAL